MGIYFLRRLANVLFARRKTAVDQLARRHVHALILAISLGSALRRSRTRFVRSAARYRRRIGNAAAIRVITHLARGTVGILHTKNFATGVETRLAGRTLRVGHALRVRRIRNAIPIDALFASLAGLLLITTDFAFPVHADFPDPAFEAVVAAHDAQTIDAQEIRRTIRCRIASTRRRSRIARGLAARTAAARAAATAAPATAATAATTAAAARAAAAAARLDGRVRRLATIRIAPETVLPRGITRELGVAT